MMFLLVRRSWPLLVSFALFFAFIAASCSKKENPVPAVPNVGKITGTVSPAAAFSSITATGGPNGSSTSVSPNADNGEFSIANLKAGTYVLSFSAAPGYTKPADRNLSLAAGETNNVGTIRVSAYVAGTVDGNCSPANSLRSARLTEPGSQDGPVASPDVNGYFRFNNVAPGTYNISFEAAPGFLPPAPRVITVSGGTTSLGVITVNTSGETSRPLSGTVRWSMDGISYTSTSLTGNMLLIDGHPRSFSLLATSLNGTTADILGLSSFCRLGLNYIGSDSGERGTYLRTESGVPRSSYETDYYNKGTVTITAIDSTARTLSGTFGFNARGSAGTITVSGGSFTLSY
jgi:hypothetical protein